MHRFDVGDRFWNKETAAQDKWRRGRRGDSAEIVHYGDVGGLAVLVFVVVVKRGWREGEQDGTSGWSLEEVGEGVRVCWRWCGKESSEIDTEFDMNTGGGKQRVNMEEEVGSLFLRPLRDG